MHTTCFLNKLHHALAKSKDWKPNNVVGKRNTLNWIAKIESGLRRFTLVLIVIALFGKCIFR